MQSQRTPSNRGDIAPFYVMEVMRAAEEREFSGGEVLHLEVGQPSTPAPAGVIAAALTPRLPIPIARAASRHTWSAYHDSLELTLETDWVRMLDCIASTTSVDLLWGDRDRIGDPAWATSQGVAVEIVGDADHHLPMTHPSRCVERLTPRP